jgi:hypothetical protein
MKGPPTMATRKLPLIAAFAALLGIAALTVTAKAYAEDTRQCYGYGSYRSCGG